ncbi:MAG: SMP-30/gluconolactonase/LRE family protein [Candidatus Methylopumilus sp.]|jgi:sugar lactone lactonase YvrE|nr:SMP-30/gluconolactonase/LRE family protein [Candidatus Methylopumilus sp.]
MRISKLLLALVAVVSMNAQAHETKKITGLKMPESAIAAKDGRVYVSEIGEFGKDRDGQITVVDKNGEAKVFAQGLDDPKGLAIVGKDLYVADNHRVIKITPDGKTSVFVAAEAFPEAPQFLNDLESDAAGNIYVSDSGDLKGVGGAIYKINPQGKVTTIINGKQDARVLAPNGLLMGKTPNCVMVVDFVSGVLYRLDMKKNNLIEVAKGFGGGDGIVKGKKDQFFVSDWKNGKVFSVKLEKGTVPNGELVKEGFAAAADIAPSLDGKFLMVPDMKAGELVYLPVH